MCGIYGAINFDNNISRDDIQVYLNKAQLSLKHRGPDSSDYKYLDNNIVLGHTRLSIIDLDNGNQPMSNKEQTIWVTFNGEIYNYIEIKRDFEIEGYQFQTNSDTEVLIALYEKYGLDLFNYVNGMFAFCLYDKINKTTILARDRFGEKPLYYSDIGNQLIFGSEIKSILPFPGFENKNDIKALGQFMLLGYIPAPRTHLSSVKKLGPSEVLIKIGNKKIKKYKYWEISPPNNIIKSKFDAIDGIQSLLNDSIKIRLRSDVPLAGFLSGGIDSTLVCDLIKSKLNRDLKTICVSFNSEVLNEGQYASMVARAISSDHIDSKYDRDDILKDFDYIIEHLDEPFGDYSIFPSYRVSKVAKECGYTVMISGDGADEIFGGYSIWYNHYNWSYLKKYRCINTLSKLATKYYSGRGSGLLSQLANNGKSDSLYNYDFFSDIFNNELNANLYNGINEINNRHKKYDKYDFPKNQMNASLFEFYLPEQVLVKVDRSTMLNSIESRTPFLDHRLIEFVNKIPSKMHYDGVYGKILLREILPDNIPNAIRWRQKRGFTPPLDDWFRTVLKGRMHQMINKVGQNSLFKNNNFLKSLYDEHCNGKDNTHELFKWYILSEKIM